MDLAIVDTTLLTFRDGGTGIVDDGALGVADGEITYVGPADGLDESADEVVDGSGKVTMPGLVNAHAHTGMTLLRGGAQDVPEIEWMNRALGPLASHLDDADRVAGAKLGVLEAVRSGATTVGEYAGRVADLVEAVYEPWGVRVAATETIDEVADDRAERGPREPYALDREKGAAAVERAEALFDDYADDDLVTPMYGPQALDMVSRDLLEAVRDRARERDRRLHVHVAQGRRERLQIEARYGPDATTVGVLDDLDLLDDRLLAAHLHDASAEERRLLADRGVAMIGCPSSIAAIDGVVPPLAEYRDFGGTAGVGTDQAPGPGGHTVLREVRTAGLLSKVRDGDPTALPAWEALWLATAGGARALGLADRVGSLAVGKRADVITVDVETPSLAPSVSRPFHTAVPNLVYAATGTEVADVFVDGEALVRDGAFVDVDADAVVSKATERAETVFDAAEADWRAADSALVDAVDAGRL